MTMVATRPQSDAHSVLPQVATRRLETRGGSSVMTVAAVTPPAPVTPSEKLCTGKTAPRDVKYMIQTHMMQQTDDVGGLTADGKYAAQTLLVPERQSADTHVAAQATPRKTETWDEPTRGTPACFRRGA